MRIDGVPRDRGTRQGGRRQYAEVVEHGDRLGPVHLRAGGVHDGQHREQLHAHRRGRADEGVQHVDGQAEHPCLHEQHPVRIGAVGVDLFAGELHPRLVDPSANAAVHPGVEVPNPGLAGRSRAADVTCDQFRETGEIVLGEYIVCGSPGCQCGQLALEPRTRTARDPAMTTPASPRRADRPQRHDTAHVSPSNLHRHRHPTSPTGQEHIVPRSNVTRGGSTARLSS